jgi:hypothetical protein
MYDKLTNCLVLSIYQLLNQLFIKISLIQNQFFSFKELILNFLLKILM